MENASSPAYDETKSRKHAQGIVAQIHEQARERVAAQAGPGIWFVFLLGMHSFLPLAIHRRALALHDGPNNAQQHAFNAQKRVSGMAGVSQHHE